MCFVSNYFAGKVYACIYAANRIVNQVAEENFFLIGWMLS